MPNRNDLEADSYTLIDKNLDQGDKEGPSDLDLLTKVSKGDKKAFGDLYQKYLDQIYNFVYFQINGNKQEAEDLTEEVFLRTFKVILEKPTRNKNFRALVYTIARNLIIDRYRTRKIELDIENIDLASEKMQNPEKTMEHAQLSNELTEAIQELRPNLQEVIILRYILELSTDEIAEIMGISHNYVRVLQYRALKSLKVNI